MYRYRIAAALLALALGGCGSGSSNSGIPAVAPQPSTSLLHHEGRWIVDALGRVVILHGVNEVWKFPPYYPSAGGFDADDAQYLASQGFNVVRTGIIYKGLEPTAGTFDDSYLAQIGDTIDTLAQNGIYTLLDFHQDMYNEAFAGEGFPDWAVEDDGEPTSPSYGFPGNYLLMPAVWTAFGHFYSNSAAPDNVGLQDHYAAAWAHAAGYFKDQDMIVGYDLFNEPWPGPGPLYIECVFTTGCKDFDQNSLAPMFTRVIAAVRTVDTNHIVFREPNPMFNDGSQTWIGASGDANSGMSWHVYCLDPSVPACVTEENRAFANADAQGTTNSDALLMSEFGATDDLTVIERECEEAETHFSSWIYWAWGGNDPTTSGGTAQSIIIDETQPPTDANLKQTKLDVLVRPFPQAIAGTPTGLGFDPTTKIFNFSYTTQRADGKGSFGPGVATHIYLPTRQYANGYTVSVNGGQARTYASDPTQLDVFATAANVQIMVTPKT